MNFGACADAPRLLTTASQDSPAFKRLTASAAAAAASSTPRCFFHAAMTSVRTASSGFCCGSL